MDRKVEELSNACADWRGCIGVAWLRQGLTAFSATTPTAARLWISPQTSPISYGASSHLTERISVMHDDPPLELLYEVMPVTLPL